MSTEMTSNNSDSDTDTNLASDTNTHVDSDPDSDPDSGSHKYTPRDLLAKSLPGDVALSDHARHRYRERTPYQCGIGLSEAYRSGEDIDHPTIAANIDGECEDPDRARIYRDPAGWGVVFIIVSDNRIEASNEVITTVISIQMYAHSPSRAYLNSHGPHRRQRGDIE